MALSESKTNQSAKTLKSSTTRLHSSVRTPKNGDHARHQSTTDQVTVRNQISKRMELLQLECLSNQDQSVRIVSLLNEIKKEKPFSQCSLHAMPLSFGAFVWSPLLDNFYAVPSLSRDKSPPSFPTPKRVLQRSQSAHSIKSTSNTKLSASETSSRPSYLDQRVTHRDKVRMNTLSACRAAIKLKNMAKNDPQTNSETGTNRSHKLGVVPKYLTHRKEEWAREEEERIRSLPDPDCPSGHVRMPESERLETLSQLQKNQNDLIEELNSLPISKDTLRIRRKREDIEKQLVKVDEGIRILSKPKVFVKVDH